MIFLNLPGIPLAKCRPKFVRKKTYVKTYDPQVRFKHSFQWQIKAEYSESPLKCPVCIRATFFMPIPKSVTKEKKKKMLSGEIPHIGKPDLDNLLKFLLDCLSMTVIDDDCQIFNISAKKVYSEKPNTVILIQTFLEYRLSLTDEDTTRNS